MSLAWRRPAQAAATGAPKYTGVLRRGRCCHYTSACSAWCTQNCRSMTIENDSAALVQACLTAARGSSPRAGWLGSGVATPCTARVTSPRRCTLPGPSLASAPYLRRGGIRPKDCSQLASTPAVIRCRRLSRKCSNVIQPGQRVHDQVLRIPFKGLKGTTSLHS